MKGVIIILLLLIGFAAVYLLLVRPMLRQWASLADFWRTTDAFEMGAWQKIRVFFDGLKIKLLARLVWVPTLITMGYDKFAQACGSCDLTPITSMLPDWAQHSLPIVSALVVPILIDWARSYSSQPAS